jgi:hypothetical protein
MTLTGVWGVLFATCNRTNSFSISPHHRTEAALRDTELKTQLAANDRRVLPCPKVEHLLPNARTGRRTTIEDVRYYTTKPVNGVTTFKCTFCEHRVATRDFKSMNGNRRTQAAAAINQHVALLHSRAARTTVWYPKGIVPARQGARS